MKKFFMLIFFFAFAASVYAVGDDERVIDAAQLPEKAKQMLATYFINDEVSIATCDKEWFGASYDVRLKSGATLEFDKDGEWLEIDCAHKAVPVGLIPEAIISDAKQRFEDAHIVKIERDRRGYDVELSNRVDLEYNLQFRLVGFDD